MSRRVVVVLWFLSSSYDEGYRCDARGGREERGVVRHFVLMVAMRDRCRTDGLALKVVLHLAVAIRERCLFGPAQLDREVQSTL